MIITTSLEKVKRDYTIIVKDVFSGFPKVFRYYYDNKDGTANIPIGGNNWLPLVNNSNLLAHDGFVPRYIGEKTLRDEQKYIIDRIFDEDLHSGVIMMKTGRGKTLVMTHIIIGFQRPALVLCHNKDNVKAIAETINQETNLKATIVMSGYKKEFGEVCVSTHSGFRGNPEQYRYNGKPYPVVLYDECDYNLSFPKGRDPKQPSMSTSLINYDADIMFGLTGTPFLKDTGEKGVTLMFGEIISMDEQDNGGYNIIPEIEVHSYKSDVFYVFENWHQLVQVMQEDEKRTEEIVEYVYKKSGNYNLALFKYVAEVDKFYDLFYKEYDGDEERMVVIKLHGQMTKSEYDNSMEILNRCIKNNIKFLIVGTTDKIGRGKDIPILDTMFLLYPCKFEGNVIQAVGRGLRSYPGKKKVMLYDWRDEHPVLLKQAKKRVKTYFNEYPGCDVYKS